MQNTIHSHARAWTRDFPPVCVFGPVADLTGHASFKAAKRGDLAAAASVVADFVHQFGFWDLNYLLQSRPCRAVAYASSSSGNRLPEAFASVLAARFQLRLVVLKQSKAEGAPPPDNARGAVPHHRSHESAWDRFVSRPTFELTDGSERFPPAFPVLMVDDVVTTGGSLSEMRCGLLAMGLWPIAAAALVSTPSRVYGDDGTRLQPTDKTWEQLKRNVPTAADILLNNGVYAGRLDLLTESEMRLMIREAKAAKRATEQAAP